jgi:hypothetical protein
LYTSQTVFYLFIILVGKTEGKRPLRKQRSMWGMILKWILEIYERADMDWIVVAPDRDQ